MPAYQPGGDNYVVGGPSTVASLLDAELIDELRLTVHPVVLGAGWAQIWCGWPTDGPTKRQF